MATNDRSREEWAAIMARYYERKDEVGVRQFAQEEGVSYHAVVYRLYKKPKRRRRDASLPTQAEAVRLVPVEIGVDSSTEPCPLRWLEAETSSGLRVRFLEGTGSEYVADLMSGMAARGL
jgi:hypothetical protein